ncbi:terpene synthase family protein [Nonomuraea sp. NPDC003707]
MANAADPAITVHLPPMYFPAPLRRHPQIEVMQRRGLDWMARHGLCDDPTLARRITGTRTAHFFGYLCPQADPDRLQIAVDWGYLMFVFDDVPWDATAGADSGFLDMAVRIIRTLETPDAGLLPPGHPMTAPVTDLARRIHRTAGPEQVRRLADSHLKWLLGAACELCAAARAAPLNANEYLALRLMYSAAEPTLQFFQLAEPDTISEGEITSARVRALTEMAGMAAALDNDLYSHGKEQWLAQQRTLSSRPVISNLIDLYMRDHTLPRDRALHAAAVLRDRIVARFVEVRDQVMPSASPALYRYLDNLTCLLRGNFEWGLIAERYTDPDGDHPGAVRTVATVSAIPAATGAPSVPAIDWWWR